MNNAKVRVLAIIVIFTLTGCVYHKFNISKMIDNMMEIKSNKSAIINILWYDGTDKEFDYFAYVYSMTGTKRYKVPTDQLIIEDKFAFTEDNELSIRINKIGNKWTASRLNLETGVWEPDNEGISIEIKPEDSE